MTALHMASTHSEAVIVDMLLKKGAKSRCIDENESTPLAYACAEGSVEIVKMLFDYADGSWVDTDAVSSFIYF